MCSRHVRGSHPYTQNKFLVNLLGMPVLCVYQVLNSLLNGPGMVIHAFNVVANAFNPSTMKSEAGGSGLCSKL